MSEPKDKVLIQRGDLLFCEECDFAWKIGEDERHDPKCMWCRQPPTQQDIAETKELIERMEAVGQECNASGPDIPFGKPIPVVPIYGWVCSRCQRVYAPHVSECSHCQPGICTTGGTR